MAMRPCLISEWRSQPIVASWPTCVCRAVMACARRVDGVLGDNVAPPHAAAATIARTPQTHAAVRVALHAEREGHVREAERVVEARRARERVLEVDEVLLRLGEDRLGRGRADGATRADATGASASATTSFMLTCARSDGRVSASQRPLGGAACAAAAAASSLRPALAAFAPWRGCSMRTQSYA